MADRLTRCSRADSGDLDAAVNELRQILNLAPDQRIGGIIASVKRVREALSTLEFREAAAARSTQLEIEAFCQIPAAIALPRAR